MAIHPLGLTKWEDGEAAQRTIRPALAELGRLGRTVWCRCSCAWLGNLAARARGPARQARAGDFGALLPAQQLPLQRRPDRPGVTRVHLPTLHARRQLRGCGRHPGCCRAIAAACISRPSRCNWQDVAFDTLQAKARSWSRPCRRRPDDLGAHHCQRGNACCRLASPFDGTGAGARTGRRRDHRTQSFSSSPTRGVPSSPIT